MSSSVRIKPLYEVSIYRHISNSCSHLFVDKASANHQYIQILSLLNCFISITETLCLIQKQKKCQKK